MSGRLELLTRSIWRRAMPTGSGFGDNLYDLIVSTGVFHSWKDPVRAIDQIHRVLKPGGCRVKDSLLTSHPYADMLV